MLRKVPPLIHFCKLAFFFVRKILATSDFKTTVFSTTLINNSPFSPSHHPRLKPWNARTKIYVLNFVKNARAVGTGEKAFRSPSVNTASVDICSAKFIWMVNLSPPFLWWRTCQGNWGQEPNQDYNAKLKIIKILALLLWQKCCWVDPWIYLNILDISHRVLKIIVHSQWTLYVGDSPPEVSTHKFKWPFKHVFKWDHITNQKQLIPSTIILTVKLGRVVTYRQELQPIKLHDSFITWNREFTLQVTLPLPVDVQTYYHKAYRYQTW